MDICSINLTLFMDGDNVMVTENGGNFSSGEKAKITLARFLYCERDIYLIDDYFDLICP